MYLLESFLLSKLEINYKSLMTPLASCYFPWQQKKKINCSWQNQALKDKAGSTMFFIKTIDT